MSDVDLLKGINELFDSVGQPVAAYTKLSHLYEGVLEGVSMTHILIKDGENVTHSVPFETMSLLTHAIDDEDNDKDE